MWWKTLPEKHVSGVSEFAGRRTWYLVLQIGLPVYTRYPTAAKTGRLMLIEDHSEAIQHINYELRKDIKTLSRDEMEKIRHPGNVRVSN